VGIHKPLPDQVASAFLAGAGGGARFRMLGHAGGSVQVGVPFRAVGTTPAWDPRLYFNVFGEF
jgi:hypothetical protein